MDSKFMNFTFANVYIWQPNITLCSTPNIKQQKMTAEANLCAESIWLYGTLDSGNK